MIEIPTDLKENKWMKLFRETEGTMDERRTVLFIEALKEYWNDYRPLSRPTMPTELQEAKAAYDSIDKNDSSDRAEAWKDIRARFSEYFNNLEHSKAQNISNKFFIEEAVSHFGKMGMTAHQKRCEELLKEYEGMLVA